MNPQRDVSQLWTATHNMGREGRAHGIRSHFLVWLLEQASQPCFYGRKIIVKNVEVRGDVLLADKDFNSPLEFEWVSFGGIFRIYESRFGAPLTIRQSEFARHVDASENQFEQSLLLQSNRGSSIAIENNELWESLVFANNSVQSIIVELNLLHGDIYVANNEVAHVVRLIRNAHVRRELALAFLDIEAWGRSAIIEVEIFGNYIKGNLNFAPVLVDRNITNMQLTQNRVEGAMRVELPFLVELGMKSGAPRFRPGLPAHGSLNVANTTVGSHLGISRYPFWYVRQDVSELGRSSSRNFLEGHWDDLSDEQKQALVCPTEGYCSMWLGEQACEGLCDAQGAGQISPAHTQKTAVSYRSHCARQTTGLPESAFLIDLTNVQTRAFTWGLEYDCLVRWHGPAFKYDHWSTYYIDWMRQRPINIEKEGWQSEVVKRLKDWRSQMLTADYQSLNTIASYLGRLGETTESRAYLEEARSARLSHGSGDASILENIQIGIIKAYLWPTGHGARPEYALYWLLAIWLLGVAVYWSYSRLWVQHGQATAIHWCRVNLPGLARWIWGPPEPCATPKEGLQEARFEFAYDVLYGTALVSGRRGNPAAAAYAPDAAGEACGGGTGVDKPRLIDPGAPYPPTPKHKVDPTLIWALFFPPKREPVRGFRQYDDEKEPDHFSLVGFSLDALPPVVNLHAFDNYFPENRAIRLFSFGQRLFGWWMITVFVTSATILAQ